jgi:hypothetical protein
MNAVRLQGLQRAPPQQLTMLVVGHEAGRRTCSEHEIGTGELCEIKWDYHIVSTTASEEATMINHVGVTNVARQRLQENSGFTYCKYPPGD